ncbi:Phosphotyrosyl phosphatase activator [Gigaspora rosea]|uniref:Serine/threonine-protein phosphatase 2A activator n=1 Tax=Gigaspora rosea TaxID=44941 RepID=A0A397UH69_9GLOM|nr:Phosphotyrosyl phosphatase activator [Gigaspora rosea]
MNSASSTFKIPKRQILTKDDLDKFQESQAYEEYTSFVMRLNDSVKGLKLTTECIVSSALINILEILDTVNTYCTEIPPVSNEKSRFGNPAFKDFYDRVTSTAFELHENLSLPPAAIPEVSKYFVESWGNRKRIDYGTGHEANFIVWLLCLEKLGLICPDDYIAVVLRVFQKYIDVMRNLQFKYWLEPAGSHGVWGLDDYHFLPFLFGSSQLIGHRYIRPKSIHDKDIVDEFSKDYMYLACIKFINSVKTASLRWNSPMLDDISGVREWKKVNEGMFKMYKGEVLAKLPIMQHFMFGSLINFEGSSPSLLEGNDEDNEDENGHVHVHAFGQEFPDCCGIKIPSAVGAKQMSIRDGTIKRLPFD